jgi:hypothetical protein
LLLANGIHHSAGRHRGNNHIIAAGCTARHKQNRSRQQHVILIAFIHGSAPSCFPKCTTAIFTADVHPLCLHFIGLRMVHPSTLSTYFNQRNFGLSILMEIHPLAFGFTNTIAPQRVENTTTCETRCDKSKSHPLFRLAVILTPHPFHRPKLLHACLYQN